MNRKTFILGCFFSISCIILCSLFYDFVMDDSFIIYRYAKNLAQGRGLVWNIGEHPVEGYTSFLWVLFNSIALYFQLDPVIFSKCFSIISAVAIIWCLAGLAKNLHWALSVILIGAVGLSPPFALLTMQGLETAFISLLLLLSAQYSTMLIAQHKQSHYLIWHCIALFCFFARPDTVPFNAGILLCVSTILLFRKNYRKLGRFIISGLPFLLIFVIYMLWRTKYFGYFFPNTFYIKLYQGPSLLKKGGVDYLASFLLYILLPYLISLFYLFLKNYDQSKLLKILPTLMGCLFFSIYLMTIIPLQGFAWRFIFPIFPAFLAAGINYFSNLTTNQLKPLNRLMSIVMLIFFSAWTLYRLPATIDEKKGRTQADRVAVGKKLAGTHGTMFVSESGALPYYSDWKAVDLLGLNSVEIAHRGLSPDFLQQLNPDLIMLLEFGDYQANSKEGIIVHEYMKKSRFVLVAVIHKYSWQYHFYFVRINSQFFQAIVRNLTTIKNVQYGNLGKLMGKKEIPIYQNNSIRCSDPKYLISK